MTPDDIITDNLPDGVPLVADFNHEYNRLDYYYPRLVKASVRTPQTKFVNVTVENAVPSFDETAISEYMIDNGWRNAFVRGMFASAKIDPRKGSLFRSQDRNVIRSVVSELIRQHIVLERPLGERLAVREYIDLEYCPKDDRQHFHETEVRYIIEDGEVVYRFPDEDQFIESSLSCDATFNYVEEDLSSGMEYPDLAAERVAREFDELSWSVDFARDAKSGEWFCIDMGLNGLYWDETGEQWVSISENLPEYSPEQEADELGPATKALHLNPTSDELFDN